ncbi:hypothetical protein FCJ59_12005 [Cupriavidus basilensis]|nr:hypothetical protein [Cupriavidus basilensis]
MKCFKKSLEVTLVFLVVLWTGCLYAQQRGAGPQAASGVPNPYVAPFGVPLAPPIYLVNFLLLYFANPEIAADMPAYRVALPQEVYDCLFTAVEDSNSCPYDEMAQYFAAQAVASGGSQNKDAAWPPSCQTNPRWANLAPPQYRQPDQINQPLGRKNADKIAQLLGVDQGMILTDEEYACLIGTPPRDVAQEIIFACSIDLTNSTGNTDVPLSSYGLYLSEGDVRSNCAPNAPCLEFNALFAGPLESIAARCGFADKLARLVTQTPMLEFIGEGHDCQTTWMPSCIAEAPCPGKGGKSNNTCAPSLKGAR